MRKELSNPMSAARSGIEQRHLQGERSRLGVDADDLVLDRLGLAGEQLLELRVAHQLGVVLERRRDLLLLGRREHGARLRQVGEPSERVASMIAPANASPNESPNEPAAEFTPAASLTRSSEIGDSV